MSDLPFTWATTVGREHLDYFLLGSFKNHTNSNSDIQGHMEETRACRTPGQSFPGKFIQIKRFVYTIQTDEMLGHGYSRL